MSTPKFEWADKLGKALIKSVTISLPVYRCVKCSEYHDYDHCNDICECGGAIIYCPELIRMNI